MRNWFFLKMVADENGNSGSPPADHSRSASLSDASPSDSDPVALAAAALAGSNGQPGPGNSAGGATGGSIVEELDSIDSLIKLAEELKISIETGYSGEGRPPNDAAITDYNKKLSKLNVQQLPTSWDKNSSGTEVDKVKAELDNKIASLKESRAKLLAEQKQFVDLGSDELENEPDYKEKPKDAQWESFNSNSSGWELLTDALAHTGKQVGQKIKKGIDSHAFTKFNDWNQERENFNHKKDAKFGDKDYRYAKSKEQFDIDKNARINEIKEDIRQIQKYPDSPAKNQMLSYGENLVRKLQTMSISTVSDDNIQDASKNYKTSKDSFYNSLSTASKASTAPTMPPAETTFSQNSSPASGEDAFSSSPKSPRGPR